jgi:hypothetical protein
MRTALSLTIALALAFSVGVGQSATKLLPGLRAEKLPAALNGSLVFLYSTNWLLTGGPARIYQLNLETSGLRVLTEAPAGDFWFFRKVGVSS